MKTRFYFYFFFIEWKKTICLLLFPCTQLPVPLGHAEERRGEERRGEGREGEKEEEEEEEEGRKGGIKKKDSLTNTNMEGLFVCTCVSYEGLCVCVRVSVCASLGVPSV